MHVPKRGRSTSVAKLRLVIAKGCTDIPGWDGERAAMRNSVLFQHGYDYVGNICYTKYSRVIPSTKDPRSVSRFKKKARGCRELM